ncbi:hypothetical protein OAL63_02765 [Candidatus Pelagibacter sp.]|nr:hypothetical protein [Candidatus Pelagibacter sp.]
MVKDQDYLKKMASFCIDLAKKLGATDSTAAVMHSISETVNFRNKKLDESDRSDSLGVSLTTYIGKKKIKYFFFKSYRRKYQDIGRKMY